MPKNAKMKMIKSHTRQSKWLNQPPSDDVVVKEGIEDAPEREAADAGAGEKILFCDNGLLETAALFIYIYTKNKYY
jgi:hypothetical protein